MMIRGQRLVPSLTAFLMTCGLMVATAMSARGDFINATDAAIGTFALSSGSPSWVDYNKDGYLDLGDGLHIMENEGPGPTGQYTLRIKPNPIGDGLFGDYDKDGWVDYFMPHVGKLYRSNSGQNFTLVQTFSGLPGKPHSAAWVDINGDTYLDLYIGAFEACNVGCYQSDQIWLNNTDGTFSRQTSFVAPTSPAYGVTTADWDRDGDMDIYVSNYRLEPNFLWQNNGQGGLTRAGNAHFGHSMGAAFGDFDNNGEFDLFAGNFSHSGQPQSRFLMNMGPGSTCVAASACFNDIGQRGVTWVESYSTPTFGDIDNDGDLDLYFASVYQEPSRLWRNMFIETGQLKFTDISSTWNIVSIVGNRQTTFGAFGDYNNDGLLDLSTANLILENDGTHNGVSFVNRHWLKVKLDGDGKFDATAIGSQVRIDVPGLGTLTRQVEGAVGTHGNQNDHTMHFGLGTYDGPLVLNVHWPDGAATMVPVSGVDQTVTITPAGGGLDDGTWFHSKGGSWNNGGYWIGGVVPSGNTETAILGPLISDSSTVFTNETITVKQITFDSSETYAIAGTGSLNLDSNSGNARLEVLQGTQKLQIQVALKDHTDVAIAGGAALEFNNRLDLNGYDLVKSGGGQLHINNTVVTGGGSIIGASGSINGSGLIVGDLENVEGTVAPGNSPGTLTVTGDFTQHDGGTLQLEIGGVAAGTTHDVLAVGGTLSAAGALEIIFTGGYTPGAGDQFEVLDFSRLEGEFTLDLPQLGAGLTWDTASLYATGQLSVAIPEPDSWLIMLSCTLALASCTLALASCRGWRPSR